MEQKNSKHSKQHLQQNSDRHSQRDPWKRPSDKETMGHSRIKFDTEKLKDPDQKHSKHSKQHLQQNSDKRRELKRKKYDPEGATKYREVNKKIIQSMRRAKDNWVAEQCCKIEDSLSKNNSKKEGGYSKVSEKRKVSWN